MPEKPEIRRISGMNQGIIFCRLPAGREQVEINGRHCLDPDPPPIPTSRPSGGLHNKYYGALRKWN